MVDREARIKAAVEAWGTSGDLDRELGYAPGTPDAILSAYWTGYASGDRIHIEGYHEDMSEVYRRVMGPRTCGTCQGPLPVNAPMNQLYCDPQCYPRYEYSHDGDVSTCAECGGEFERAWHESDKDWRARKFCDPACAVAAGKTRGKIESIVVGAT